MRRILFGVMAAIFMIWSSGVYCLGSSKDIKLAEPSIANTENGTVADTEVKTQEPVKTEKKAEEIKDQGKGKDQKKDDVPDIPAEWGKLINAELVKDTGYLVMYFQDEQMKIRVAIFEMGKKVKLYKLVVFERGTEEIEKTQ